MSKKIHGLSKRNWKCFFVGFILAWVCAGGCCAAFAGVPVKFTVETSRADVQEVQCYHGETLDFDVTFKNYGKDLVFPPDADAQIFWQTNGMSAFYWRTNNVNVVSNRMTATFLPEMDPGANTVFGFIGIPGDIYRASFVLRLKQSPGVKVREMEWPYRELNFAQIEVKNAPYYTKDEADELLIDEMKNATNKLYEVLHHEVETATPGNYQVVSNNAMRAVLTETDPTVPNWAKQPAPPVETDPTVPSWAKQPTKPAETDPTVPSWAKQATPPAAPRYYSKEQITNETGKAITLYDFLQEEGVEWKQMTNKSGSWNGLAIGEGVMVGIIDTEAYVSEDWQTWTKMPELGTVYRVAYGNEKFLISASDGSLYESTNGTDWELAVKRDYHAQMLCYANGYFFMGETAYHGLYRSEDGENWTSCTLDAMMFTLRDIAYGNGKYVLSSSSRSFWSSDGIHWYADWSNNYSYTGVGYANERFVRVSEGHGIYYSEDGENWTQSQVTDGYWDAATSNGRVFVAAKRSDGLWYSEDGNIWKKVKAGPTRTDQCGISKEKLIAITDGEGIWISEGIKVVQGIRVNGKEVKADEKNRVDITIPNPGNYTAVSNAAMTAMQPTNTYNKTETDQRIAGATPGNYNTVSNNAMRAVKPEDMTMDNPSFSNAVTTAVNEALRGKIQIKYDPTTGDFYVETED